MKMIEKTFTIELTEQEIEIITTALHGEYKHIKEMKCDSPEHSRKMHEKMVNIRGIRNSFASLIGRMYMGEDA